MTLQPKHKHRSLNIYSFFAAFFARKTPAAGRYQLKRRIGVPADQA